MEERYPFLGCVASVHVAAGLRASAQNVLGESFFFCLRFTHGCNRCGERWPNKKEENHTFLVIMLLLQGWLALAQKKINIISRLVLMAAAAAARFSP